MQIHDPGIVDFYFAPKASSELVARWRSEGKLLEVTGPPIRSFELVRLMRTLRTKANQLPKNGAGVIVLHDTYASLEAPLKVIAYELDEVMQGHPHVSAAAVVRRGLGQMPPGQQGRQAELGLVLFHRVNRFSWEEILVVRNPSARWPLDDDLLIRLLKP